MATSTKNLKDFLADYPGYIDSRGNIEKLDYQNVSIDTRTLQPGQFFIPLKGDNFDGHRFVYAAIEKGASGVAVEQGWYADQAASSFVDTRVIVVKHTLDVLQQLASWHRKQFNLRVIGLTGSNGKTTVRKMVSEILANRFQLLSSEGNQNNHIGAPLTLLKIQPSHEIAVIEMGTNHPGEIALLSRLVDPDVGLITNIGKGHIGFFGSLEAIYEEKTALFNTMRDGSLIFQNMDDPFIDKYERRSLTTIRVGSKADFDYWGRIISLDRLGCVKLSINDFGEIQLKIPGGHHFSNALLSAAVGLHFEIPFEEVKRTLENFQPVSQRMQIYEKNGVLIINDAYNANPDSMSAAINYLASVTSRGKRIIVLGDMLEMGDFGEQEHFAIGKYINGKPIDYVFLFGPLSAMIQKGILASNSFNGEVFRCETHEEITEHLKAILAPNDVLLVKGSRGMQMEKTLNGLF